MSQSNNRKAYHGGVTCAANQDRDDAKEPTLKAYAAYYGYRAMVESGAIIPSCDASVAFVQGFNTKWGRNQ